MSRIRAGHGDGSGPRQLRVYVDGDLRATVDTLSAVKVHRVVVWTLRMSAGDHVVRLVNAGTHGRTRIDLDAVITDNESL